ncbi:MAG: glycoside hydrolase family 55 protein [Actinobacteria bacterium]|nr:glycoside hydrolase family 55 protein [Actinomycetota bacterium]
MSGSLNVRSFGATGDGVSNDRHAINDAIAAAISAGRPLYFPAGTYAVSLADSGGEGALPVRGSLKIVGDGPDQTVIEAIDYNKQDGGVLFYVFGAWNLTLEGITLQGPPLESMTSHSDNCIAIFSQGDGSLITLTGVTSSLWNLFLRLDALDSAHNIGGKLLATGCHLKTRGEQIFGLEGVDRDVPEWRLVDCIFECESPLPIPPPGQGPHNLYMPEGISLSIDGCDFRAAGQYGVTMFGTTSEFSPRFCRIATTHFGPGVPFPILTNRKALTEILNCRFEGAANSIAISAAGDFIAKGCEFTWASDGDSYAITEDVGDPVPVNAQIIDCTFNEPPGPFGGLYHTRRRASSTSAVWMISGCRFGDSRADGMNIAAAGGRLIVWGNTFRGTSGVAGIRIGGGTHDILHNLFAGNYSSGAMLLQSDSTDTMVNVRGNIFATDDPPQIVGPVPPRWVTLSGQDNRFYERASGRTDGFVITGNPAQVRGDFQAGEGVGEYTYDPVTKLLAINYNYNSYRVNEPGETIENIYFGSESKYNVFTSARITLYAVKDFNLGGRGNIAVPSLPSPVPQTSIVTLRYFPALMKWVKV